MKAAAFRRAKGSSRQPGWPKSTAMTRRLRSSPITEPSSLLRGSPPLSGASVLSASRLQPLAPFPLASPARFSRSTPEPDRASRCLHAGCRSFRRFRSSSLALASLDHACRDQCLDFSATLTTVAFDHSRSRWLGIDDLIAEPEGPSFISSAVAQRRVHRRCS